MPTPRAGSLLLAAALVAPLATLLGAPARADTPVEAAPLPPLPPPAPSAAQAPPPAVSPAPAASTRWGLPRCSEPEIEGDLRISSGCSGVFGLRGSVVDVHGATAGAGAGLMFFAEGEDLVRGGVFSARGVHRLGLGGGGAGLEGALLGDLALGMRFPIAATHGPIVRAGGLGYLLGDDAFYASLLELPEIQLGYQFMRGHTVIEVAGTTGVVLTGRYRGGDAHARTIGHGFELGAYAAVQIPWFRLGATVMALPTDDGLGGAVDVADANLCAVAAPFAICADGRVLQSRAVFALGAPDVRTVYVGLAIGLTRER